MISGNNEGCRGCVFFAEIELHLPVCLMGRTSIAVSPLQYTDKNGGSKQKDQFFPLRIIHLVCVCVCASVISWKIFLILYCLIKISVLFINVKLLVLFGLYSLSVVLYYVICSTFVCG